jgi:hypothetical protein
MELGIHCVQLEGHFMRVQRDFGLAALGLTALTVLLGAGQATAAPITYTLLAGGASGSLGGVPFNNAALQITANADTTQIVHPLNYDVPNLLATVTVDGLPTATFTISTLTFDNQGTPALGVESGTVQSPSLDILDIVNPAFANYNLSTPLGPLVGPPLFNSGAHFATSSGDLVINSIGGQVTFLATLGSVPEPSTVALLGLGIAGLAGWRRWNNRRRAPA